MNTEKENTSTSDEEIIEELYNLDPYRYRPIPAASPRSDDGLLNVRIALRQARQDQDHITRERVLEWAEENEQSLQDDDEPFIRVKDLRAFLTNNTNDSI